MYFKVKNEIYLSSQPHIESTSHPFDLSCPCELLQPTEYGKDDTVWFPRLDFYYKTFTLIQGKEQRLRFAGTAVKRYPMSKVRETQVRR